MKAARLHGPRDVRIEEVSKPVPGPGQVLVRVRAVSICPSDWRLYVDGHAGGVVPDRPIVQGHEFSGDVAALGRGVAGPALGTRVAVEPTWPCGDCDMCRAALPNLCRRVVFPSFPPHDGALAEYIACPAACVCALPADVDYAEGALVEPLGVAMHAVRLATPKTGQSVAVLGAGTIGMCVVFLLKRLGVRRLAVVEPASSRRTWPGSVGAAPVCAASDELVRAQYEADVVYECSGAQTALDQAIRLARPAGRIVVVGIPRDESVSLDMAVCRRRELTVVFCRRSRDTLQEAVRLVASGEVDLRSLPRQVYTLEDTAAALEATGHPGGILRAIVTP